MATSSYTRSQLRHRWSAGRDRFGLFWQALSSFPKTGFYHVASRTHSMNYVKSAIRIGSFLVTSVFTLIAVAQDPPADLLLGGNASFDLGRHLGGTVPLGTIDITSDLPAADPMVIVPARPIEISQNGFAFLSNDILIRNGSDMPLVFDAAQQTHTFDVFYFGEGDYDLDVTLPAENSYTNGSGETVTAFGGHWTWQADYTRLNGSRQTFSVNDERFEFANPRISPVTLEPSNNRAEISRSFNRTNSTQTVPSTLFEPNTNFNWSLSETSSTVLERVQSLLEVSPAADGDPEPVLDLSGINIQAAGTALRNRIIGNPNLAETRGSIVSSLGRFVLGTAPDNFSTNETVTVPTSGTDDQRTRLTLGSFNESLDGVTATLANPVVFDNEDAEAEVQLSANFAIDAAETGTFFKTVDVRSFITGEQLARETVQESLDLGFTYSIVENNSAIANDITVFKFEGEDSTGRTVGHNARPEFSGFTHTAIQVDDRVALDGNDLQSVTLSEGDGITGEGLPGENVTATATFDVHTRTVQTSDLSFTESGQVVDQIEIENLRTADPSKVQAQAILIDVEESGSTRWSLAGLEGWDEDLAAGESITLNTVFDETGIDNSAETLGRNYRKTVTFRFRDGVRDLASEAVNGTSVGDVTGRFVERDFNIIGSNETIQEGTWFLERKDVVTGASGEAFAVAGTSLGTEGFNLTNESDNTSSQVAMPTEFQILDSETLTSDTDVTVQFVSLDAVDPEAAYSESDTSDFYSDVVEVSGLDGTFHVMSLSYDPELGPADLQWYSEDLGVWFNAVLGNSNIALSTELVPDLTADGLILVDGEEADLTEYLLEMRFEGSYNDYLLSLDGSEPILGAFGSSDGSAWAVIDHNSAFSVVQSVAIPEPGNSALIALILCGFGIGRSRRRA